MPPLNHLPGSGVRAVMGNALIIGKVTAFQNLPVSFSLSLSLGPSSSSTSWPQSHPLTREPAAAQPISGSPAAVQSPETRGGSEDEGWGQLQFATVSWFHLGEMPPNDADTMLKPKMYLSLCPAPTVVQITKKAHPLAHKVPFGYNFLPDLKLAF